MQSSLHHLENESQLRLSPAMPRALSIVIVAAALCGACRRAPARGHDGHGFATLGPLDAGRDERDAGHGTDVIRRDGGAPGSEVARDASSPATRDGGTRAPAALDAGLADAGARDAGSALDAAADDAGADAGTTRPLRDPPCALLATLASKCWGCHGESPRGPSKLQLVTYAQLTAPSDADASQTNAQRSLIRMQDTLTPMPTGAIPRATAAELAVLAQWIDDGYPVSQCGALADDPYEASTQCTSGVVHPPTVSENELMNPGRACNACHRQGNDEQGNDAPIFAFVGTLYPSAHEPDECDALGVESARVVVTDAHGTVRSARPNAVGNFMFEDDSAAFLPPYTARVVYDGRERWMDLPQQNGDCNSCHDPAGNSEAPGRLLLP
jgi:hypothetical protein